MILLCIFGALYLSLLSDVPFLVVYKYHPHLQYFIQLGGGGSIIHFISPPLDMQVTFSILLEGAM